MEASTGVDKKTVPPASTVEPAHGTSQDIACPPWLGVSRRQRRSPQAELANFTEANRQSDDKKVPLAALAGPPGVEKLTVSMEVPSQPTSDHQLPSRGKCVIVSQPISKTLYRGQVKWFRGTFGWVECAEVAAMHSGSDAYLHINDCTFRPRLGDKVCFRLALGENGHPKAVQASASKEPEIINARDWFATDRSKRHSLVGK